MRVRSPTAKTKGGLVLRVRGAWLVYKEAVVISEMPKTRNTYRKIVKVPASICVHLVYQSRPITRLTFSQKFSLEPTPGVGIAGTR